MTEKKQLLVYAAAYETVEGALADLDAIEQLHKDEIIGQYHAAVVDKEGGKPHVVNRMEKGLDKPLTKAARVVKRTVEATTEEITSELQEALKS